MNRSETFPEIRRKSFGLGYGRLLDYSSLLDYGSLLDCSAFNVDR